MRITPLDILQADFNQARRGFEPTEVRAFLENVRTTLEETLRENHRLKEVIAQKDEEIATLRQAEAGIKETLVLARQLAGEVRKAANREADLVVGEARIEAERILMAAQDEHRLLVEQLTRLKVARVHYLTSLHALVDAQRRLLVELDAPLPESGAVDDVETA